MSIPIDKLYHYIESLAQEIRGSDDIIIYRFYPHGSKKLENLLWLRDVTKVDIFTYPPIYCNDQEPLDYDYYNMAAEESSRYPLRKKYNIPLMLNFKRCLTIYDKSLLIHSEKRSTNLELYQQNKFIPVYYWSHGIIALDWYRYAQYEQIKKNIKKQFLIYNRAWSNSRQYRLKFIDLLIDNNITDNCLTTINPIEPQLGIHYTSYTKNQWTPSNVLENYFPPNNTTSCASANYNIDDYNCTEIEVVLETLFDDDRLHLTEKVLRPIALGQPFLLAATHGSLEYLRSYGFKTFATVIDESYDTITDPLLRLEAIVRSMKEIANWTEAERTEKMKVANDIAAYNRQHFFSDDFFKQVTTELRTNLSAGMIELENTNTAADFINYRKTYSKIDEVKEMMLNFVPRQDIVKILSKGRKYYNKH